MSLLAQIDDAIYEAGRDTSNTAAKASAALAATLNALDAECGEWRSVSNLLMEAAVKARQQIYTTEINTAYAEACERVATMLSEAREA